MQKKKIAMLMSAVMILSGTAMPSEMAYAMDDIQISAEETDEAGSSEESEPEDQETDVEEDADDFGDDSSGEEVSVEPQDGENESEDEVNVFSDEENAAVGEDEKGEPVENGSCGDDATYKLYADGTLYIEGTGEVWHYFYYNDNIKSVIIGEGITSISYDGIFQSDKNLVSVTLPESLTDLGNSTFEYCSNLTTINLPGKLTNIGQEVFSYCSSLSSINLPEGITSIGQEAFSKCTSLSEITWPTNITRIEAGTFSGCNNLTSFDFSNITSIGNSAFSGCGFKTIVIPENVTDIGNYVFSGCENLRSAKLPSNIEKISNGMFNNCKRFSEFEIPASVKEIGDSAFAGCNALTEITLPEGLTSIGDSAFSGTGITEFKLPTGLQNIGNEAFASSTNLKTITIPESVTDLGSGEFVNCYSLNTVVIKANITELKEETFEWCNSLKNVTLPDSLKKIGKNAFWNCFALESIELPDNINEIDEYAFQSCNIKSINFPQNLTSIGYGAFNGCDLVNMSFPEKLQTVDTDAFKNCTNLRSVYIPGTDVELATRAIGYKDDNTKYDNIVLIGKAGSTTEAYAKKYSFTFHNIADKLTYVPAVAATCLAKGNVECWHCDTCNINFSNEEGTVALDQIETDIIPHDLVQVNEVDPTCTKAGVRYHWHCNSCGKNFEYSDGSDEIEDIVIPAIGHDMYFEEGYEATCRREGRKDYYHCGNCGKNFLDENGKQEVTQEELIIPKKNDHTLEFHQGHIATCQSEGLKDYYQCTTCGKLFLDENGTQEVTDPDKELRIPRKEHKMVTTKTYLPIAQPINPSDGRTHPIESIIQMSCQTKCTVCGWQEGGYGIAYKVVVNTDGVTLKYGQSTTAIRISGLNSDIKFKKVTSGNKKIVTISDVNSKKGTFKLTAGKKSGSTVVRIELSGGWTADVQITVQSGTVKTNYITGLKKSVNVSKGKTYTLKPTLDPITSQEKVTYSSSNTKVATVNSKGVITGKAAGTAKITVKSGSKKATITVKVAKVKTTKLSGVLSSKTVKKGKTFTIKASVTPKNSDEKVIYKTSNKKIATVTSKGVVKGIKKGTATVTVQSGSKKQTCKVTVK